MLGAYGVAMASRFNGFGETETMQVEDLPWTTMYSSVIEKRTAAVRRPVRAKSPRRLKVVR